jgi:hypothetical protein
MVAYDIVALRAICASYIETKVIPLLTDVQHAQEKLQTQLCEKNAVALERIECLIADMAHKATLTDIDVAITKMSGKAPMSANSDESLKEAEQKLRDKFLDDVSRLEERVAHTEKTVRSHAAKIAEIRDFGQQLECKANVREVPTVAQFQRLAAAVERKPNAGKVATAAQLTELQAEMQTLVDKKVNVESVPTLAQFHELSAEVAKKCDSAPCASELRNIHAEMQHKANISDVPTAAWIKQELDDFEADFRNQVFETLAPVIEKRFASVSAKVAKNAEDHRSLAAKVQESTCLSSQDKMLFDH